MALILTLCCVSPAAADPLPAAPIVAPMGEFTSSLAGPGGHMVSFTMSLEALNFRVAELLNADGWRLRIRNEILLTVQHKTYEDLTGARGARQFAEEIKITLNSQLPGVRGEAPVVRVLLESFVVQ